MRFLIRKLLISFSLVKVPGNLKKKIIFISILGELALSCEHRYTQVCDIRIGLRNQILYKYVLRNNNVFS